MPRPTDGELEILRVLWNHDGLSARQIRRAIGGNSPASASSIGTRLKIMEEKNLVRVDASVRPKVFRAAVARAAIRRLLLRDLAQRLFDGSMKRMVMHLISTKKATPQQMKQISKLVDGLDDLQK